MTNSKQLLDKVHNFSKKHILVIGDIILDKYSWCNVERISPEAPVPVAHLQSVSSTLGGAANVVNNLMALDVKTDIVGVIGDDDDGRDVIKLCTERSLVADGIIVDASRPTTVKMRIMSGNHQLLRLDKEYAKDINKKIESKLLALIKEKYADVDGIILADYAKGLLTRSFINKILLFARKKDIKVFIDPTAKTFYKYKNIYLIKPNKKETEHFLNTYIDVSGANLELVAKKILKKTAAENVVITLGKDGLIFYDKTNQFYRLHAYAKEVYDVSGAGDTTIATIAVSLLAGASLYEACILGNVSASIVVSKVGTAICTREELIDTIQKQNE